MGKLLQFPAPKEEEPRWLIRIKAHEPDFIDVEWEPDLGQWMIFITTSSFEQLVTLREQAVQMLKASKAVKEGAVK